MDVDLNEGPTGTPCVEGASDIISSSHESVDCHYLGTLETGS